MWHCTPAGGEILGAAEGIAQVLRHCAVRNSTYTLCMAAAHQLHVMHCTPTWRQHNVYAAWRRQLGRERVPCVHWQQQPTIWTCCCSQCAAAACVLWNPRQPCLAGLPRLQVQLTAAVHARSIYPLISMCSQCKSAPCVHAMAVCARCPPEPWQCNRHSHTTRFKLDPSMACTTCCAAVSGD